MDQEPEARPSRFGTDGWLFILCLFLTVWNPAIVALRLASSVANLSAQTALSLVLLAVRLVVTSVGVAAGFSLWLRRPWAAQLAKTALILVTIEAVVRLSTRIGLSEAPPGTRMPLAILTILHNAAWYLYLHKSRRVRAMYNLESPPDL
ncbi:MAG: hypothetical protein EXQ55_02575 [Acidobacteria bacterium]|nr:hypothetical protein [Acidobacteriota bacterium]